MDQLQAVAFEATAPRPMRENVASSRVQIQIRSKATGVNAPDTGRLSHIYQLSGFADPVYAEACVTVHDYDIVLEASCWLSVILWFFAVRYERDDAE